MNPRIVPRLFDPHDRVANGRSTDEALAATPTFFRSSAELRAWLRSHHRSAPEIWIGFRKRGIRRDGITHREALDQALCFGWIDGILKRLDEASYAIRFTPRRPRSDWSAGNVRRVGELRRLGLMDRSGVAAFEARRSNAGYASEDRPRKLPAAYERQFRAEAKAWAHFQAQPPGYRRTVIWWVLSAKKEETRTRRLGILMADSDRGLRLDLLAPGRRAKITVPRTGSRPRSPSS